jgi:hypothetical protein
MFVFATVALLLICICFAAAGATTLLISSLL